MSLKEEIIIGFVAPIGTNLEKVKKLLEDEFNQAGYETIEINITDIDSVKNCDIRGDDLNNDYEQYTLDNIFGEKIRKCNNLRETFNDNAILAKYAIREIKLKRNRNKKKIFIIRQFKRFEEVLLMRSVLGRAFFCLGINESKESRKEYICHKIKEEHYKNSKEIPIQKINISAQNLIDIDEHQDGKHGQQIRDTFHLCDYFINNLDKESLKKHINHFYQIIIHHPNLYPFVEETYMAMAYLTAKRSSSITRQVGAIIVDENDMIVSSGYNDVPKFGGGYDNPCENKHKINNHQDITSNEAMIDEIISQLLTFISNDIQSEKEGLASDEMVKKIKQNKSLKINNLIEFFKDLHAENGSIIQAAAYGRTVKGCTLYVTTFPCHLCIKNIIGSGIKRIIYLEPYPKSRANEIFKDLIEINTTNYSDSKVQCESYSGVAPNHYLEAFDAFRYYMDSNNKFTKRDRNNNETKEVRFVRDDKSYMERQNKIIESLDKKGHIPINHKDT